MYIDEQFEEVLKQYERVSPGRARGNTTRQIDSAVQRIFTYGQAAFHDNNEASVMAVVDKFTRRLYHEHGVTRDSLDVKKDNSHGSLAITCVRVSLKYKN